jgi:hypothetical protein
MKSSNTLDILGATLTILGSFLPWENGGGFLGLVIHGIRVDFANLKYWLTGIHEFPVYDYGGVLVVLLTLVIILVALHPPGFIKGPLLWKLIVSAILMASSLFFLGRGLIHQYEDRGSAEPSSLMIGLICVVLGSALLLWRSIMTYRQVAERKSQSAG